MLAAVANVSKLSWGDWIRGVIGAFVSGGAGAIASGVGANLADPGHDINIFKVMAFTFAISGIVSLGKFLQTTIPTPQAVPPAA